MKVREPVTRRTSKLLAVAGLVTFIVVWCVLSYGNIVPTIILPSPTEVLRAFPVLHFEEALVRSAWGSFRRVTLGFALAGAVAIPLGIVMGTFPVVKHFFNPLLDPLRFLPISALVPLFIVWFGIDELQKIVFLFVGIFVYMLPLVVEAVDNVEEVYLQTATTLGATRGQLIRHVLIPGSLPAIGEALRVMNGIGWTYVIMAEVINARYGLGYLITTAGKRSHVDQIFALVLVILFIGVVDRLADPPGQRAALPLESAMSTAAAPAHPYVLELRNVGKAFVNPDGKVFQAIRDIDLQVEDVPGAGEFRVFLGPSGCGKSTILNIVAGLYPADHRPGAAAREADHRAGPRARHGLPELQLVPVAHRARQRRLWPDAARGAARAARADRPHLDREGGPEGDGEEVPAAALRRHAAAGGHRADAGREAPGHPHGRAVRRPRRPDPPRACRT